MKNQLYTIQKAVGAKVSNLRRCGFHRALVMTVLVGTFVLATSAHAQGPFLSSPCASESYTFACFQVNVNPNFAWLLNPGSGVYAAYSSDYPGWSTPYLTSPGLQDDPSSPPGETVIGESAGLPAPPLPASYPIQIGMTTPTVCGGSLEQYSMPNGSAYYYPTFGWQYAPQIYNGYPNPTSATLTEIQYFTLTSQFGQTSGAGACPPGTSYLYPNTTTSPTTSIYVKAGYQNFSDPARRSIGMIVSSNNYSGITPAGNDFPAESFFDVFVEVTLPSISSPPTLSGAVFPATGALLINDSAHPLIVANPDLTGFPTGAGSNSVFYLHSAATPPAPLVFEYDNPNPNYPGDGSGKPYWWHKGDTFGWIQLAGHGIFTPCDPGNPSPAWTNFMAAVLGTPGHRQPAAPVGGVFPNTAYPWPTCSYSMSQGTNFGGQAWDAITFTNATTISAAFLTMSNFQMSVALPAYGSSITYTNTNTIFNVSWSLSGLANYVPTQTTGTVVVLITNTNTPANGVTTYNTTLLQCSAAGLANFGQWALQLDTTKPNAGLHMVQALGQGYRITGYFDAWFQVSANGGATWTESDAPNRLYLGDSPCGASIEPIHSTLSGSNVIIDWANPSYTLEGSPSLNPAAWSPISGGSPVTLPVNTPYRFFRLTCD